MGRAILDALSEISAGIKDLKTEVSDLRGDVKSAKVTNELTAETLMEWRPQLSNEVKAIHDKLEEAEKRYGPRLCQIFFPHCLTEPFNVSLHCERLCPKCRCFF